MEKQILTNPTVSVVIPVYNRSELVLEAIESVLVQTVPVHEVLVVDDASSDDVVGAIASVADERVRLIRRPRRGGASAARNSGIAAAKGAVIGFLDSDDVWHPQRVERGLRHLGSTPVGLSCCSFLALRDGRASYGIPGVTLRPGKRSLIALRGGPFTASVFLVRREAIDAGVGFDEDLPTLEDLDFAVALESAGFGVGGIRDVLVLKRRATGGDHLFNFETEYAGRTHFVRKHRRELFANRTALRANRLAMLLCMARMSDCSLRLDALLTRQRVHLGALYVLIARGLGPKGTRVLAQTLLRLGDLRPEALLNRLTRH
jgi:glycosyltransferase involved in cell wall biosynthesis